MLSKIASMLRICIIFRIYKNITDSVKKRGPVFERVFKFCVDYKLWWYKRGRETPLVDRLVFNKIRYTQTLILEAQSEHSLKLGGFTTAIYINVKTFIARSLYPNT